MTAPMMQRPEIVMPTGMQGSTPASPPVRQQDPSTLYARQADPRQYGNPPTMGGFGGGFGGYGGFGGGYGGFNPMMGYGGFGGGYGPMMGGYGGFGGFGGFNPMMGGLGGLGGYGMFGGRFNPQMGGRFGFGRQPQFGGFDKPFMTDMQARLPDDVQPLPAKLPQPQFGDMSGGLGGFRPQFPQYQYQPSIESNPSVDVTDYRKLFGGFL